jgi:hypothetical protein
LPGQHGTVLKLGQIYKPGRPVDLSVSGRLSRAAPEFRGYAEASAVPSASLDFAALFSLEDWRLFLSFSRAS